MRTTWSFSGLSPSQVRYSGPSSPHQPGQPSADAYPSSEVMKSTTSSGIGIPPYALSSVCPDAADTLPRISATETGAPRGTAPSSTAFVERTPIAEAPSMHSVGDFVEVALFQRRRGPAAFLSPGGRGVE